MKVWYGFGSEHSTNLVMIGRFRQARDANKVKEILDQLIEQVSAEPDVYKRDAIPQDRYFSDAMLELLRAASVYSLAPAELEQFSYDASVRVKDKEVVVTTEEVDVSAFLKVLLDKGARIEVYSAHDYPDTEYGRGR
jgi:hypothetical protein